MSRRNLHLLRPFKGRNFDRGSEDRLREADLLLDNQVVPLSGERRMLRDVEPGGRGPPEGLRFSLPSLSRRASTSSPKESPVGIFTLSFFDPSVLSIGYPLLSAEGRLFQGDTQLIKDIFSLLGHPTHVLMSGLPAEEISKIEPPPSLWTPVFPFPRIGRRGYRRNRTLERCPPG